MIINLVNRSSGTSSTVAKRAAPQGIIDSVIQYPLFYDH